MSERALVYLGLAEISAIVAAWQTGSFVPLAAAVVLVLLMTAVSQR